MLPSESGGSALEDVRLSFLKGGGEASLLLQAIDWASHPLGPPEAWPNALQTTAGIVLRARQPMFVCWGPEHHTLYNDAYSQICGNKHPAGLGGRFRDLWPEIWDSLETLVAQVYSGKPIHMDDIELLMHRKGYPEETHFSFSYTPLDEADGRVGGFLCVCAETTEQVILKRELDHQRNQLGQIFEQAPTFIAKMHGPDHVFEIVNPAYRQLVGHRDILGKTVAEAFPEIRDQGYVAQLDSVLATGKAVKIQGARLELQRHSGRPGEERFIDFVYEPVLDSAGKVTGVFASGVDVTERIVATAELRASEQFLRSVLGASSDCIMVLGLDGRILYWIDNGRVVMDFAGGTDIEEDIWTELWDAPAQARAIQALDQARSGSNSGFQGFRKAVSGDPLYWDVRLSPMENAAGQPERILVVSRDISYLKRVEDERDLLTRELSHRLKNAFAMVQSMIRQTLRSATSVARGRDALLGRVQALEAAQDILTRSSLDAMPIEEVLESALAPHRTGEGRFVISGPPVRLEGRQGLGLSLALHELSTNAAKYGALSAPGGRVIIEWALGETGAFSFRWREVDGPEVVPPATNGFGTALIKGGVGSYFEGSATLDFPATGVVFHLEGRVRP